MVEIKNDAMLLRMREAGRVVAQALEAVRDEAVPGVTLTELDRVAREVLAAAGAGSPFLGYRPDWAPMPFPAVACLSVNDAIVHGVPDGTRLADGDLVSVDCGAVLDGWVGDAAVSFTIGRARPEDTRLVDTAYEALEAGIAAAVVGNRVGDIAHAVGRVCRTAGDGIPDGLGGHGVGRTMHEGPDVPNEGRPGRGMPLRHGMVVAIEPMLIGGGHDRHYTARDGWTIRTLDGSRAAHTEHTVAVTDDGPRILTAL
ncbi:type I methionyl aminopeptidase [Streptomyces roseicoloratus]|uniref:Methionine aminopeptidase n=1 Tax=Streptomyces roseicoloratus TaxID=2508722 RepID=A0ABY9RSQ5_9ACTN|nr:type I methionyl aminopeptidase [Streptomyces roseicoloratus]WMX44264.1 type I methionyl aminopeptidase [Streptomyces roseicoloratus]